LYKYYEEKSMAALKEYSVGEMYEVSAAIPFGLSMEEITEKR